MGNVSVLAGQSYYIQKRHYIQVPSLTAGDKRLLLSFLGYQQVVSFYVRVGRKYRQRQ